MWIHTRGEVKKQKVYCPILVVATNKSLTFYEVSVKSFYMVSLLFSPLSPTDQEHQAERRAAVVQSPQPARHRFGDRQRPRLRLHRPRIGRHGPRSTSLSRQRLQSLSLNIAPDHTTTMVSTFYRATYLIQYCQQRGFLYVFAFSNRENEFKYYNTVAL